MNCQLALALFDLMGANTTIYAIVSRVLHLMWIGDEHVEGLLATN